MSALRLIVASFVYHWRTNLAVACGVAAGTAVLSGALLVGDSMRGSLRHLTLDRLGRIDEVLVTERFFRQELADELAGQPEFKKRFGTAVPVVMLRASLENVDPKDKRRANRVNLLGCDTRFWQLWPGQPPEPSRRQIVLNRPLADRLGVQRAGEEVILHLPNRGSIPGDSPLGMKRDTVGRLRLGVAAIIPGEGPGRFSLRPNQRLPLSAYVSIAGLQDRLERPGRVNAILVAGKEGAGDRPPKGRQVLEDNHNVLARLLRPAPTDYGLRIEEVETGPPSGRSRGSRYINITSDRLLLEPAIEAAIRRTLEGLGAEFQPVLTYLANAIDTQRHAAPVQEQDDDGKIVPYSTITAIDFAQAPPLGPFLTPDGDPIEPLDGEDGNWIVVNNSKATEGLGVEPGDRIYVTYFRPESTHGQPEEQTREFRLAAIVDLAGAADDRAFTPVVPGLTDKESIYRWEVPFSPFRWGLIRTKDEEYFKQHGLTPKAFVSLASGQRLWGSRFGRVTGFRVKPDDETTIASLTERLQRELEPARLGFTFQPVKLQGLEASAGTTDFNLLFIGFSSFIIAAAMMLVALLFRLGIDQRAAQLGILAALGFSRRRVALLLAGEGLVVATLGSLLGVPAGVGYAALMVLGLRSPTWWLKAVGTPFLQLHLAPPGRLVPWSLVIGFSSGVVVAVLAILWAVWRSRRFAPRQLLAGQMTEAASWISARPRYAGKLAVGLLIGAVAFSVLARWIGEEIAFFAAGALLLIAALTMVWGRLRSGTTGAAVTVGHGNLLRMALRNAARNPGRSTLTIGLVAAACFLIVAVSAFHVDPSGRTPEVASGNGGFALVAESDQPIYHDLNTPEGRKELGFSDEDLGLLAGTTTIALRVKSGDDASCLNLYRPRQPRVLGVPRQMIDRGGFVFAASAAEPLEERENPWLLLEKDLTKDGRDTDGVPLVPVILEKNTATYSLHLTGGVGQTYEIADARGRTVRLKIVGLLGVSIFQGDLLISETAFLRHFPEESGYRFFLTETPVGRAGDVRDALENTLGDYGLAAEKSGERLARFLRVQNTYLSTFQNLGGLGLLLGTLGLAAVQLRNVVERRGELALLRAAGFRRRRLAQLVMLENGLLLGAGLGCGVLAALVAVLPHLILGGASIRWPPLAGTLALVLAVGLIAGLAAVRAALSAPLLAALREGR